MHHVVRLLQFENHGLKLRDRHKWLSFLLLKSQKCTVCFAVSREILHKEDECEEAAEDGSQCGTSGGSWRSGPKEHWQERSKFKQN